MLTIPNNAAALPADLKYSNRFSVLSQFRSNEQLTANNIADSLNLSRQTVMKNIQFFLKHGLLVSVGKAPSTNIGGKRPELFSLTDKLFLLCIELWPEELCLVLMDFQSNMIDKLCVRQPLLQQATGALDAVGKLATKFLQQNNVPLSLLRGVCISTPGIVDYRTSMLKFNALAPQWGNNIPIVDILRAYFGPDVMIVVENVGKLTARALLHDTALLKGQNLNDKRLLTVFTSWGLSGCLIDRGRIHNGKHALIGEFGHMTLEGSYPFRCGCGSSGCFEQVVGNTHIQMRISQECSMYPDSMLQTIPVSAITVETIFDMSERGDELARKIDAELAQHFAVALRNISLNFDQECVVIQGIFSNADDYFKQQLNEKLMEFHYYFDNTPFEIQYDTRPIYKLDQMGAYAYMLDSYLSNSELYAGV